MMFVTTSVRGMGEGKGQVLGTITSDGQFINDWLLGNKRRRSSVGNASIGWGCSPGLG